MVQYTNFYETLKEAEMRLSYTAVLYDGEPYIVLCVTDHKEDGIFRVYLDPFPVSGNKIMWHQNSHVPNEWCHEPNMTRGQKMDEYLAENPSCPILRKKINSPLFNKFRPFPLGMCNVANDAYYLSRTPSRHTQQGLMENSITQHRVSLDDDDLFNKKPSPRAVSFYGAALREAIKGNYPSFGETVEAFSDPSVTNKAVGFTREFALIRGPMNILFLDYKQDIIGYLPKGDGQEVILGRKFRHTKEVVSELNVFDKITLQ